MQEVTGEGTHSQGCREMKELLSAGLGMGKENIGEKGKNGDVKKKKKGSEVLSEG